MKCTVYDTAGAELGSFDADVVHSGGTGEIRTLEAGRELREMLTTDEREFTLVLSLPIPVRLESCRILGDALGGRLRFMYTR